MLFREKKSDESMRARRPIRPGRSGAQPVFSYHAQSARTLQDGGRRSTKLFWTNSPAKPLLPRRNPRHWPRRVLVVSAIILGLAFFANSLFLGRDPKIVVLDKSDGSQYLVRSKDEYRQAAQEALHRSLANSNKVTINTAELAKTMQQQFPELERVSITLPIIGRQPVFYVEPSRPALLVKDTNGAIFVLDETGRAIMPAAQVAQLEKLGLPVVEDQSGLSLKLGKSVLPSSDIAFMTEVMGQLKAKKMQITMMSLPARTSELDVRVEGAPYLIKYNLRGDARAEVGAFLAAKQHLEREKKTPGSYIDVRVDNRVYYK